MTCPHLEATAAGLESAFTVEAARVTFGRGALAEVGDRARALGITRVGLFTDPTIAALPWFAEVAASLRAAAIDVAVFDAVAIEPTDASIDDAARFARDARLDGYVSIGGGSTIDTAKLANLLARHGGPLRRYVSPPLGDGERVPELAPHLACPTTCGTGSEVTAIAVFKLGHAKTGISSSQLRPSEAIVDPRCTATLPASVVAASGMDVLCHALESYTARSFSARTQPMPPTARPLSQGANPWSDLGCREALRLLGVHLRSAVAGDREAREQVMWAATLAGIAFGNAGVHAPHAMAYAVAGLAHGFRAQGYPMSAGPLVPHGMAVAVSVPAVARHTAPTSPARHLEIAALLGADTRGAAPADAGDLLATTLIELMRAIAIPNGLAAVGYAAAEVAALVTATLPQRRLLDNAPSEMTAPVLDTLFHSALGYW